MGGLRGPSSSLGGCGGPSSSFPPALFLKCYRVALVTGGRFWTSPPSSHSGVIRTLITAECVLLGLRCVIETLLSWHMCWMYFVERVTLQVLCQEILAWSVAF